MDEMHGVAMNGIEMLERELIVRDFISLLNTRVTTELVPFLTEEAMYELSPSQMIQGRRAITGMLDDVIDTFEIWHTSLIHVAVTGDVVLAEQCLQMRLPGHEAVRVFGFASFRLEGYRIARWHQSYA